MGRGSEERTRKKHTFNSYYTIKKELEEMNEEKDKTLMGRIRNRIKSVFSPEVDISFIEKRAVQNGYAQFRGDHIETVKYFKERIKRRVAREPWINKVKNIDFSWPGGSDASTLELDYEFSHIKGPDISYIIRNFNFTSSFISKLAEVYRVWPELAEEILESYLVYAEGHINNYQLVVKGELPIKELKGGANVKLAFEYLNIQRGIESAVLVTYWFQAYIADDYDAEEHTAAYFKTFMSPYISLTSAALKLTQKIEEEYQKRLKEK